MNKFEFTKNLLKVNTYVLFIAIVYAVWIGIRMSQMLSAGEEIATFLKTSHTHILLNSFLFLFVIYDARIKVYSEKLRFHWFTDLAIQTGVLGVLIFAGGVSIAALYPSMIQTGIAIFNIGNVLILYSFLSYIISMILAELWNERAN